jgi:hypothetical protein
MKSYLNVGGGRIWLGFDADEIELRGPVEPSGNPAEALKSSDLLLSVRISDGRITGLSRFESGMENSKLARDVMTCLDQAGQLLQERSGAPAAASAYAGWVEIARRTGDKFFLTQGLNALGLAKKRSGEISVALRAYEEAISILGFPFTGAEEEYRLPFKAFILQNVAALWHQEGNKELCVRAAREGLDIVQSRADAISQQTAVECKKHLERYSGIK